MRRIAARRGGPGWSARASSARREACATSFWDRPRRPLTTAADRDPPAEYPGTVAELPQRLREGGYLAGRGLAGSVLVSLSLHRPLLPEGEVGAGKTEIAKVLAADNRDFRPSTLGMMVAAPHIDLLLSGHDLASLEELAERLPVLN